MQQVRAKSIGIHLRSFPLLMACALGGSVVAGSLLALLNPSPAYALGGMLGLLLLIQWTLVISHITRAGSGKAVGLLILSCLSGIWVSWFADFTVLELVAILPLAWLVTFRFLSAIRSCTYPRVIISFLVSYLGLLALGFLNLFRTDILAVGFPARELLKNAEIGLIALGVFSYVDKKERLFELYGLLLSLAWVSSVLPVLRLQEQIWDIGSLQTIAPVFVMVLLLPFTRTFAGKSMLLTASALLVISRTRGGWIGLLLVAAASLYDRHSRKALGSRIYVLPLGAIVLLLLIAIIPGLRARVETILLLEDQSLNDRLGQLRAAWLMLSSHPLTGIGPGQFKAWLVTFRPDIHFRIGVEALPLDPHNTLAKFAAELGIPGLVFFSGWVGSALMAVWKARTNSSQMALLRPYVTGLSLYSILYVFMLATSIWGAVARFHLGFAAGLMLSLLRVCSLQPHQISGSSA